MLNAESALVLAPHADDGELGCGGTIARLIEQGTTVYYIAFSICELSIPEGYPTNILATEVTEATAALGIATQNLIVHRYPVRTFPKYRQAILDELIDFRNRIQPDIVFVPAADDVHQDHHVLFVEGLRAFKYATLLGYELPWNSNGFAGSAFVSLGANHLSRKIEALAKYQSQSHRSYTQREAIEAIARLRGLQAGDQYAEAFQVIRWMIR